MRHYHFAHSKLVLTCFRFFPLITLVVALSVSAAGRTPPNNPDVNTQAQECLDSPGADGPNGRVHNRLLWCKRGTLKVQVHEFAEIATEVGPFPADIEVGEATMPFKMVAYGRDDGERGISIFFRGGLPTIVIPDGAIGPTTDIAMNVACRSKDGCGVLESEVVRPLEVWQTLWTRWDIQSEPEEATGNELVSWHKWFLQFQAVLPIPAENIRLGLIEDTPTIRCDSAQYFNARPGACVFWDVVPHIQYSLTEPKSQEAVAHIFCALTGAPDCPQRYPIATIDNNFPQLPGQFTGQQRNNIDELRALHRIPSAGMTTDKRAENNRAEATKACQAKPPYALSGIPPDGAFPGLPTPPISGQQDCDEYPFASTREGAALGMQSAFPFPVFSVRAIGSRPNRCAGSALGHYYRNDRILYRGDPFFVEIVNAPNNTDDECSFEFDYDLAVINGAEEVPSAGGSGGFGIVFSDGDATTETLSADAGPDVSGAEGGAVLLHGFANFASSVQWSYLPISGVDASTTCTFDAPNRAVTHFTCTDNGTFQVTLTASNPNGQVSSSATVTLRNVAPVLSLSSPTYWQVFRAGTPVDLTAPFTDAGSNDTQTCAIVWDDGKVDSFPGSGGNCNRTHTFANAGMYTITVNVTDDNGGTSSGAVMVVVYDPNGGFETAGGYIDTVAGALSSDPNAAGRAHFQFNPKYLPGDPGPVPSGGKFQYSLDSGNFSVVATGFDWLVATPGKAAVKGTATVGGQSGFGFIAYAYDDPDKFRLIVWPLTDGPNPPATPLYDLSRGARQDLDVAQPISISAGSIQVHQ